MVKVAKYFNESPREYIKIQNRFLLAKLQSNHNTEIKKISRHQRPLPKNSIRHVLREEFLEPRNLKLSHLAKHLKIGRDTFRNHFRIGSDSREIDFKTLGRIGDALGTGPKFWLDLQTKMNVASFVKKKPWLSKYFDWDISAVTAQNGTTIPVEHPGVFLEREFLRHSGIRRTHWADFFWMDIGSFNRILTGEGIISLSFIALLVKAFGAPASLWIEMQNAYLSQLYLKDYAKKYNITELQPTLPQERKGGCSLPGRILSNRFLRPLKISRKDFARHIGVDVNSIKHLIERGDRITPGLAIKLGQALGTSSMYWLDLQMECDLSREELKEQ